MNREQIMAEIAALKNLLDAKRGSKRLAYFLYMHNKSETVFYKK